MIQITFQSLVFQNLILLQVKVTKEQFQRAIAMVTINIYYKLEYKDLDLQMLLRASSGIAMSITEGDAKFAESTKIGFGRNCV